MGPDEEGLLAGATSGCPTVSRGGRSDLNACKVRGKSDVSSVASSGQKRDDLKRQRRGSESGKRGEIKKCTNGKQAEGRPQSHPTIRVHAYQTWNCSQMFTQEAVGTSSSSEQMVHPTESEFCLHTVGAPDELTPGVQ